jgi:hypothetical protein
MIDFVWAVLCSRSIIDQGTNNLSLIDVIEQISLSPDTPIPINIPLSFEVVTLWSRGDLEQSSKGWTRVTVYRPSNIEILKNEFEIDLSSFKRFRHRLGIRGLSIEELGKYIFQIELRDEDSEFQVVARLPLEIDLAQESE